MGNVWFPEEVLKEFFNRLSEEALGKRRRSQEARRMDAASARGRGLKSDTTPHQESLHIYKEPLRFLDDLAV